MLNQFSQNVFVMDGYRKYSDFLFINRDETTAFGTLFCYDIMSVRAYHASMEAMRRRKSYTVKLDGKEQYGYISGLNPYQYVSKM